MHKHIKIHWLFLCLLGGWAEPLQAQSLREVFKRVNPSVVVIHTQVEAREKSGVPATMAGLPDNAAEQGMGSGVLITADGKIITAAHVIQKADHIEVEFVNGERRSARVVAAAPAADIAMLQLDSVPAHALVAQLADSNAIETGDQVFAIGAPFGARHSLASGWISARRSTESIIENLSALETFQVDLALYQGNSGGPLFNLSGEIVGIVTHLLARENQATGPGFAVTSNTVRKLMLEDKQRWMGIEAWMIDDVLAESFNVPQSAGMLVQSVAANSLAARLGIREGRLAVHLGEQTMLIGGDILLEMCGVPVRPAYASVLEMQRQLNALRSGDLLKAKVWRSGQVSELTATIP